MFITLHCSLSPATKRNSSLMAYGAKPKERLIGGLGVNAHSRIKHSAQEKEHPDWQGLTLTFAEGEEVMFRSLFAEGVGEH